MPSREEITLLKNGVSKTSLQFIISNHYHYDNQSEFQIYLHISYNLMYHICMTRQEYNERIIFSQVKL